jgi:hypothetical protein
LSLDESPIMPLMDRGGALDRGQEHAERFPVPAPPPPGSYEVPKNLFRRFSFRDVGPDVQSRFTYQAACVALYAILTLLDDEPKHVAIYCEVLEDFLLQHADGRYAAVQVKTRERNRIPFKTSDEEMLSTLFRFGDYESQEGPNFHRYVIATNAGFWKEKPTWHNLNHVRQAAASASRMANTDIGSLISPILAAAPPRYHHRLRDSCQCVPETGTGQ